MSDDFHGNNRLLTQEEVNQLPDGTEVFIEWSGGNSGKYVVLKDKFGVPSAHIDILSGHRIWVDFLCDVSTNPLLTNVSLAVSNHGNNRQAASTLTSVSLSGKLKTPPACFTKATP